MLHQKNKLKDILFVDIETVPMVSDFDDLPEDFKGFWQKKVSTLKGFEDKNHKELFFERGGIYSEFGKIVCVSAGFFYESDSALRFRCKAFINENEKNLLENFANLLNEKFYSQENYLCGHNLKEFDIPYLARRMLINQVPLPAMLNIPGRKPWEVRFIDTMELWKFGDFKNFTSLALLAALFNIPAPKDDMNGQDVANVYWKENNLRRIAVYCNKDVVTTARLYLKYCMAGELPESNIESIV